MAARTKMEGWGREKGGDKKKQESRRVIGKKKKVTTCCLVKTIKNPADMNACPYSEKQVQEHQGQEADPVPLV